MECVKNVTRLKGSLCCQLLFFITWLSNLQDAIAMEIRTELNHTPSQSDLASPPGDGLFQPIEISPAIIPSYPFPSPDESLPPMYPSFPTTYEPVLTGKCPVNFSALSVILDKTASDCSQPLAAYMGNVICCPQFSSFLHIFQGFYTSGSDKLVLQNGTAYDCFSDIVSILASRRANNSIAAICSVKPSNLTGEACPVKDITVFEKMINTSKLLESCSTIDHLKECCRPICHQAITEATLQISSGQGPSLIDAISDCKQVVYSWLARKLPLDVANTVFRILSACKVNKGCPLELKQPVDVMKACGNIGPGPSCCSALNSYISNIQKQMLITNRQAIGCATLFGSMLQKGGVMKNVYELCDVDLKDFSLQAYGQQGCLLRSLPTDVVFDNMTGFSFTCDLTDNIAAPWPSSSSITSLSLCAPEMSLPALPTSEILGNHGYGSSRCELFLAPIFSIFLLCAFFMY